MGNTSKRYNWTEEQLFEMDKLYKEEYSLKDIAVYLGCTYETIRYHLLKRGIKLRGRGMQTQRSRAKYSGDKHHGWNGGRYKHNGYTYILKSEHPNSDINGYIPEHRFIMEQYLNQKFSDSPALKNGFLRKDWIVHHINGLKSDNQIGNLQALPKKEHSSWLHYKEQIKNLEHEVRKLKTILKENKIDF